MTLRSSIIAMAVLAIFGQAFAQDSAEESWVPGNHNVVFTEPEDFWVSGEFWLGWVQGQKLPALVTTSPSATPVATAGILGLSTTTVLFSGTVNDDFVSGFRFGTGYVVNREAGISVQAGFSFLPGQSTRFAANSSDFDIIGRPYIDVKQNPDAREAVLVAHPLQSTGSLTIEAKTENFYDAHLGISERVYDEGNTKIDALFGYRYGHFSDSILFRQRIVPTTAPTPTTIDSRDSFEASNHFNGVDFGFRTQTTWDNVSLSLLGKLAAGNMSRELEIAGTQVATATGSAPVTSVGGVYALVNNIGKYEDNAFSIFPEFGANVGWQVRSNLRVRLGYTGMVLGRVARAANQIDYQINPDRFPPATSTTTTPDRPSVPFRSTDIVIQSLSFGADLTF